VSALPEPYLEAAPAAARVRRVADVMSHGVVTVDGESSVREVARTMRDRGVTAVFVVDLGSEAVGVVDERALLRAWDDPSLTAAALMDLDPVVIDPHDTVADATRHLLSAGVTQAIVAPPPPTEESGRWSAWKERGLPVGTLAVADILARLDDVSAAVRARPAAGPSAARRAAPWLALISVVLVVAFLALIVFLYASGTHHLTNKPGLQ
jgi:CBS domain-containing protein